MSQAELKATFDLRVTSGSRASPVPGHLFSSPPINKGDQDLSSDLSSDSTKKPFGKGLVAFILYQVLRFKEVDHHWNSSTEAEGPRTWALIIVP